jgi:hypothetical protein
MQAIVEVRWSPAGELPFAFARDFLIDVLGSFSLTGPRCPRPRQEGRCAVAGYGGQRLINSFGDTTVIGF